MIVEMVLSATLWLNMFPHNDGISDVISPRGIIIGMTIDYAKHCRLEFGSYTQVHEDHDNSMDSRTTGAIALRPTGNAQGGYYFMSLAIGRRLNRNHSTTLPMPQDVIDRVHTLARRSNASNTLQFTWQDGTPIENAAQYDESDDVNDDVYEPNNDDSDSENDSGEDNNDEEANENENDDASNDDTPIAGVIDEEENIDNEKEKEDEEDDEEEEEENKDEEESDEEDNEDGEENKIKIPQEWQTKTTKSQEWRSATSDGQTRSKTPQEWRKPITGTTSGQRHQETTPKP
jgi:hypothetical protein